MTFPDTALDLRAELLVNGAWADVSPRLDRGNVQIGRGQPDESTTVSASTLAMPLNNSDAALSMSNPASPYYPALVRNVPARISLPAAGTYMRLEEGSGGPGDGATDGTAYASCPGTSKMNATTSLEVQVDLQLTDWREQVIASQWTQTPYSGWVLRVDASGRPVLSFGVSGSAWNVTAGTPLPPGRTVLRVVLTAPASAPWTVTFYTGTSVGGSAWTQLGGADTGAAAVTLVTSASPLTIGYTPGYQPATRGLTGKVWKLTLWANGKAAAYFDATIRAAGTVTWKDSLGDTWTLSGGAEISGRDYRGYFEVPEWPQSANERGTDVTVAVSGGGLLRRISQRQADVSSPLYRAIMTTAPEPVQYWPCEQLPGSTQAASAVGGPPFSISGGTGDGTVATSGAGWGQSSSAPGSDALPTLAGSSWTVNVPPYAAGGECVVGFLADLSSAEAPSSGSSGLIEIIMRGGSPIGSVYVSLSVGGELFVAVYNTDGSLNYADTPPDVVPEMSGPAWYTLIIEPDSVSTGYMDYDLYAVSPGAAAGHFASSASVKGGVAGTVAQIRVNPQAAFTDVSVGHIGIWTSGDTPWEYSQPLNAWDGEAACPRFSRLCAENGIPFRQLAPGAGVPMGQQTSQTITDLLQEVIETDLGIWTEPRDSLSWGYIPGAARCRDPDLTVSYEQAMLSPFSSPPTEDDQDLVNDVTVTGNDGAQARQYAAPGQPVGGGRLSVLAPPDGCQRYDTQVQANPAGLAGLNDVASQLVRAGTPDEPRLPGIVLDLTAGELAGVFDDVLALDIGGVIEIDGMPAYIRPGQVRETANQLTEVLGPKTLEVTVAGAPAGPWNWLVLDDPVRGLLDTDGSALAAAATAAATTLSVATTAGPLWDYTNSAVPFDLDVGGERVTVTKISGTASPQTMTVARSVNGVVKAQAAGTAVRLWQPNYLAIGPA